MKILKITALSTFCFLWLAGTAHAVIIPVDMSIQAETNFDESFGIGVSSGDFSLTSGETTTTSNYSGSTVTGTNPLTNDLFDSGDGIGFTGSANATDDFFAVGFDGFIDLTNNSVSDIYDVVIKLIYSNQVEANGGNAYADSEFSLLANGSEIFFTDLLSDSLFGNAVAGNENGSFGGTESESGTELFNFVLNPADLLTLDLSWTVEGEDFDSGESAFAFSQFLSIESVTKRGGQVPPSVSAPSSILLFVIALVGLVARNTKKTKLSNQG